MAKKNKQNTSYLPPEGWCCRTLAELWPLRRWWRIQVKNNPKWSKNLVSQHFPIKLCVYIFSHLYPAHCIPSSLSPSNLIIALASIWLYWNLIEVITIIFFPIKIKMVWVIISTCIQPPQSVLHQSRPACLLARPDVRRRPGVENLQSGRDRCSKDKQLLSYHDHNDRDDCAWAPLDDVMLNIWCASTSVSKYIRSIRDIDIEGYLAPPHACQTPTWCFSASDNWTLPPGKKLPRPRFW